MPVVCVLTFLYYLCRPNLITEIVAQLVRASDCGSEGRGFEPHQSPPKDHFVKKVSPISGTLFLLFSTRYICIFVTIVL